MSQSIESESIDSSLTPSGPSRSARRRRRNLLIAAVVAVVVIAVAVVIIVVAVNQREGTLNPCVNSRVPGAVALPRICV